MQKLLLKALAIACLTVAVTGCTTGNARLAAMSAPEVRDTFKIGVTTTDDVRTALGEPMEFGVETVKDKGTNAVAEAKLIWYYSYQKVSARFFTPFIPPRPKDILRGRLMLGFNSSNVLEHVDYYGNQ